MPGINHFQNQEELIKEVEIELQKGLGRTGGELPQVLVIGALGRSGKGTLDLFRTVKIPESKLLKWDMPETQKGGPFTEIRESDVSIGPCAYACVTLFEANFPRSSSIVSISIKRYPNLSPRIFSERARGG